MASRRVRCRDASSVAPWQGDEKAHLRRWLVEGSRGVCGIRLRRPLLAA